MSALDAFLLSVICYLVLIASISSMIYALFEHKRIRELQHEVEVAVDCQHIFSVISAEQADKHRHAQCKLCRYIGEPVFTITCSACCAGNCQVLKQQ